jgi:hypothetical protein
MRLYHDNPHAGHFRRKRTKQLLRLKFH